MEDLRKSETAEAYVCPRTVRAQSGSKSWSAPMTPKSLQYLLIHIRGVRLNFGAFCSQNGFFDPFSATLTAAYAGPRALR